MLSLNSAFGRPLYARRGVIVGSCVDDAACIGTE
jgi:hypothetical protein